MVLEPASVHMSDLASTFSKIFSETAWLIKAKFDMKHLHEHDEGGTNVYINNPGQLTKMAAMPIYGKKR